MKKQQKAMHLLRTMIIFVVLILTLGSCARGISNKKVGKLESESEAKKAISKIVENYPSLKTFGDSTLYKVKINDEVEFRSGNDFRTEIEISSMLQGKVSKDTIEKINKLVENSGNIKVNLKSPKGNDFSFEKKGYNHKIGVEVEAEGKAAIPLVNVEEFKPEDPKGLYKFWLGFKGFFKGVAGYINTTFWLILLIIAGMIIYKTFFSK